MSAAAQNGPWKPILTGSLAERAGDALEEIATSLRDLPPAWVPDGSSEFARRSADISLSQGLAGLALFYAYLSRHRSSAADADTAVQCLNRVVQTMAESSTSASLYGGFTGAAWVAEHLHGWFLDPEDEDPGAGVDEALKAHLGIPTWEGDYDLVAGLVGFGVYALERLPRPAAKECLESVVRHLDAIARRTRQGITWFTRPEQLFPQAREMYPQGHFNLGVAHGVPGILALLGWACAAGVAGRTPRSLLEGGMEWLVAQRLNDRPPGASFPYCVGPGVDAAPARSAWCYGDPGIAAALLAAARCMGQRSWERRAIDIAVGAATRPPEQAGVRDAGLCHGAAGLAHLFNRMFQATWEESLERAAKFWFERALRFRRPGEGLGGFLALQQRQIGGEATWEADPGILTGTAGVGLALLAALSPIEPAWDRFLLASIPA